MTDEQDQGTTEDLGAVESMSGEMGNAAAADISVSFGDYKVTEEDVKDAAKWTYRKLFGHEEKVETGGISLDLEDHEEVAMRSTSVAHEDPPPPAGTEDRD